MPTKSQRVVITVTFALAVTAWAVLAIWLPRHRIIASLAELQAAGQPVSLETLADQYRRNDLDGVDITGTWLAAIAPLADPQVVRRLDQAQNDVSNGSSATSAGSAVQPQSIAHISAEFESIADQIIEAAAQQGLVRYPIELSSGLMMNLDHLTQLRRAARLMRMVATEAARQQDETRYVLAIASLFRLPATLHDPPNLATYMTACDLIEVAATTLQENSVAYMRLSAENTERLRQAVTDADVSRDLQTALQGERAIGIGYFIHPDRLPDFYRATVPTLLPRYADLDFYLQQMETAIQASAIDASTSKRTMKQRAVRNATSGQPGLVGRWLCRRRVLSLLLLPHFESVFKSHERALSQLGNAQLELTSLQDAKR